MSTWRKHNSHYANVSAPPLLTSGTRKTRYRVTAYLLCILHAHRCPDHLPVGVVIFQAPQLVTESVTTTVAVAVICRIKQSGYTAWSLTLWRGVGRMTRASCECEYVLGGKWENIKEVDDDVWPTSADVLVNLVHTNLHQHSATSSRFFFLLFERGDRKKGVEWGGEERRKKKKLL